MYLSDTCNAMPVLLFNFFLSKNSDIILNTAVMCTQDSMLEP